MPPCAFDELFTCSEPFVASATCAPARSAETYTELISETPVVQKVIDNLDLKTSVRALQGAVKVKPITNTNIIVVQVAWSSPEMSAKIANDFATVFVAREAELVANTPIGHDALAAGEGGKLSHQGPATFFGGFIEEIVEGRLQSQFVRHKLAFQVLEVREICLNDRIVGGQF